jgi:quinolinate synthase
VSELPGLSSFNVSSWNALAAPGKTPAAVVNRLNAELVKVLATPDMVQRLAADHPEHTIFCLDPVVCPCSTMYRTVEFFHGPT